LEGAEARQVASQPHPEHARSGTRTELPRCPKTKSPGLVGSGHTGRHFGEIRKERFRLLAQEHERQVE
jgi:hypothetical protein